MNHLELARRRRPIGRPARSVASGLRDHWVFASLFALGALLRVMALVAYRPALLAADSQMYLGMSMNLRPTELHPAGYAAFVKLLRGLTDGASLAVIPAAQHLLGLAAATTLYLLQSRLGVARWLAALAVAPLLLDAYWLNLEHYVMSEALTLSLLVAGCAALLWRQPLGWPAAAAAALALAAAGMTRTISVLLLAPAAVAVLALAARGRRLRTLAVFVVAAALPLAAYAAWFHAENGRFAIAGYSERYLYGRVATFVDCSKLSVPVELRPLCPDEPVGERWHPYYYVWFDASPYRQLPEATRDELAGRFADLAISSQPLAYAGAVAGDLVRGFAWRRESSRPLEALWRWEFQPRYPLFTGKRTPPYTSAVLCGTEQPGGAAAERCAAARAKWEGVARRYGDPGIETDPRLAGWLASYREFGYVPGPLLAIALGLGVVGAFVAARRRLTALWTACFVMSAVPAILIIGPVLRIHFGWRYQILALALVPVAGALGATALRRARRAGARAARPAPALERR